MTATTPFLKDAEKFGPLASRYVEVESLPWKPTPCPGIDMKILLEDPESGLLTALFRWQPGAELALHEHVEIEQTFVLEGSLVDDEGEVQRRQLCLASQRQPAHRQVAEGRAGPVDVPQTEYLSCWRRGRPGSAIAARRLNPLRHCRAD